MEKRALMQAGRKETKTCFDKQTCRKQKSEDIVKYPMNNVSGHKSDRT